ncbi:PAS domain-containing methyl-accepting chemotaxis protein [uncultured Brevundimonas sp.]|uniref:methyl-accepting chemotaxis protein n=1 Tax=uncultured Brevundimonas sp. TaxID=213418 RepID=UPI0030ED1257|tara:strand:- start:6855 stop:8810 length:1956 start_codon:yes stop_codon:yes gene_type:complete
MPTATNTALKVDSTENFEALLEDYRGQVEALRISLAVIEFGLDGIIQDANDNFLNAVGYTLAEVRGQHHSIFMDPSVRQSPEYRMFWEKLGRGEFESGQFRRVAKGGREIWIQASYNPIMDTQGKPMKVVKYASDITAEKLATANYEGQLAAIGKSQAVIEFGLDGIIVDANDNFLNALGYTLSEVRGQHHSMFVDPSERQSPQYRMFWEKLGRGEYDAGQYKRITKTGGEIWIQASYNPIMDMNGKPMKVVKYATDITAEKLATANYEGQLAAISKSQAVIEFSLDGKIVEANPNFLNALGYTMEEIRGQHHSMFVDPSERQSPEYRMFWEKLGRGEFDTGQYKRVGKGGREIWIQASYNPIMDMNGKPMKVVKYASDVTVQRKIAERVKEISNIVSSASSEMRATAESMARTAEEATIQAGAVANAAQVASSNVQTVSAAGEELSASISEIARQVAESTNITQRAVHETDTTKVAIQTLAEAAQKIGNVVTLINNIAGQTKLLALNATIEAARAGDAGKGFAVVASEVKSLSDQTAKATHEISSEVSAMQAATTTSVSAIQGIADTIGKVAEIAAAIASAVEEQSAATGEISANVTEAAASTQEVSANIQGLNEGVAQTSAASAELLQASGELAHQAEALSGEMDGLLG